METLRGHSPCGRPPIRGNWGRNQASLIVLRHQEKSVQWGRFILTPCARSPPEEIPPAAAGLGFPIIALSAEFFDPLFQHPVLGFENRNPGRVRVVGCLCWHIVRLHIHPFPKGIVGNPPVARIVAGAP